jgi:hypothetical protein
MDREAAAVFAEAGVKLRQFEVPVQGVVEMGSGWVGGETDSTSA